MVIRFRSYINYYTTVINSATRNSIVFSRSQISTGDKNKYDSMSIDPFTVKIA